jgi:hypothetical protein
MVILIVYLWITWIIWFFVVVQHPQGRSEIVIELAAFGTYQKGNKESSCYQNACDQ